jgi:hypothetical protein
MNREYLAIKGTNRHSSSADTAEIAIKLEAQQENAVQRQPTANELALRFCAVVIGAICSPISLAFGIMHGFGQVACNILGGVYDPKGVFDNNINTRFIRSLVTYVCGGGTDDAKQAFLGSRNEADYMAAQQSFLELIANPELPTRPNTHPNPTQTPTVGEMITADDANQQLQDHACTVLNSYRYQKLPDNEGKIRDFTAEIKFECLKLHFDINNNSTRINKDTIAAKKDKIGSLIDKLMTDRYAAYVAGVYPEVTDTWPVKAFAKFAGLNEEKFLNLVQPLRTAQKEASQNNEATPALPTTASVGSSSNQLIYPYSNIPKVISNFVKYDEEKYFIAQNQYELCAAIEEKASSDKLQFGSNPCTYIAQAMAEVFSESGNSADVTKMIEAAYQQGLRRHYDAKIPKCKDQTYKPNDDNPMLTDNLLVGKNNNGPTVYLICTSPELVREQEFIYGENNENIVHSPELLLHKLTPGSSCTICSGTASYAISKLSDDQYFILDSHGDVKSLINVEKAQGEGNNAIGAICTSQEAVTFLLNASAPAVFQPMEAIVYSS